MRNVMVLQTLEPRFYDFLTFGSLNSSRMRDYKTAKDWEGLKDERQRN
jgi:hypothetical protein